MSRLPPLIALSYFEVAARTKSFAEAAKELNVTPAAISHQIKSLEAHLAVELFVRHHRRVSLTPAGRAALPALHEGFRFLSEAVDNIRLFSAEHRVITVCAEPLFATKWIVPRLHRFYARCPEAEVRLQASLHSVDQSRGSDFGVSHMRRAGIDVSVRLGYGDYANLEPQRLMSLELVPMSKPGLISRVKTIKSLAEHPLLSDSTLSRFDKPCGWYEWFSKQDCKKTKFSRELQFGNGLLALEAALSGQGVLLGIKDMLHLELAANKLEVVIDRPMCCDQAYYVVGTGKKNERPIAREFRQWLLDEALQAKS